MELKKYNAVHPLNVFTIPLAGPGFQSVIRKEPVSFRSRPQARVYPYDLDDEDDMIFRTRVIPVKGLKDRPKGLESLTHVDHLFVKQSQLITAFFLNVHNKYEVLNSAGEFIFLAAETTPPLTRIFCFGGQPFEIAVNTLPGKNAYSWNAKGTEVLKLAGSTGSCGCGSEINVSHSRKPLGSIEQEGDCTRPLYTVKNRADKNILQVQGPSEPHYCFTCGIPETSSTNLKFDILSPDGSTVVGRIAKQWTGPLEGSDEVNCQNKSSQRQQESLTRKRDGEMWGIRFPAQADLDTKGLLLSVLFLLEYQYYNAT